jgi:transposase-like protein
MDLRGEKTLPKEDEFDDVGTWIWLSMASESRLVLSHVIGVRSQRNADELVANTAKKLQSIPLYVTDGLKLYTTAFRKQYGKFVRFAPTGKRGRPRKPKLIVNDLLKYAQVIKRRDRVEVSSQIYDVCLNDDNDAADRRLRFCIQRRGKD